MSDRPEEFPRWASGTGAEIVEPTEAEKDDGYVPNTILTAQLANWLQRLVTQWIEYLDSRITGGARELATTDGPVDVASGPPPTVGQVLTGIGDHVAGWADAIPLAMTPPSTVSAVAASAGAAGSAARGDHVHGVATAAAVGLSLATANAPGTSASLARADHTHAITGVLTATAPSTVSVTTANAGAAADAARADHIHAVSTAVAVGITPGGTSSAGLASTLVRSDHTHALPAYGSGAATICQGNDARLSDARAPTAHAALHAPGGADAIATAAAVGLSLASTNAAGTASSLARSDHTHAITGVLTSAAPSTVSVVTASAGAAADASRADHVHGVSTAAAVGLSLATANAIGSSTSLARADHTHAITGVLSGTAPSQISVTTAAAGAGTAAAREDHVHSVATGTPSALTPGGSNAIGVATSLARSDHAHALPAFGTGAATICEGNDARLAGPAGVMVPGVNQFRLSSSSTSSISSNGTYSTIHLTPHVGCAIGLYSGTAWALLSKTTAVSLALSGMTAGTPVDIFAYNNAGNIALETTNWTNATTRATALVQQDGVWVKSGAPTRRYVGTILPSSATQFIWQETPVDTTGYLSIWNADNRLPTHAFWTSAIASFTHTSPGLMTWNSNSANVVYAVVGLPGGSVQGELTGTVDHKGSPLAGLYIGQSPAGSIRTALGTTAPTGQRHVSRSAIISKAIGVSSLTVQTYSANAGAVFTGSGDPAAMFVTMQC